MRAGAWMYVHLVSVNIETEREWHSFGFKKGRYDHRAST